MLSLVVGLFLAGGQDAPLQIQGDGSVRHPSTVRAIAITPDSQTAFVALNDGALLAYALPTRKPLEVKFRVYATLFDLALNARGDRLAVVDGGGNVTLLEPKSLRVVRTIRLKSDPERVVYHPDGTALFVALANGHLLKMRASDLTTERDIFPSTGSRVLALACSRDGSLVATTDKDGQIKLWSSETLTPVKTWKAHPVVVRSLAFDPSEKYLLSGGDDATLKVWNLSDGTLVKEDKEYHQLSIEAIACGPDGRLVTGGYDGLCQFWDGKTFTGGRSYPNYRGYITACAIAPDGQWLVRGGSSLDFVPLDRPDQAERVADYGGAILGFDVAEDAKRFATGGLDRRLIAWKIDKGVTSRTALLDDWVTAVAFCRNGQSIAVALVNGKVEMYAADTLEREASWQAHKGRIAGLASVAGRLVSAGEDGAVHVWSLAGVKQQSFDEKAPCRSIGVRGNQFAVGTMNGTVSVYGVADGAARPRKHLRGRPLSVTALGFSGGGSRLLVGYFDGGLESFDTTSWAPAEFRPGEGESVLAIDANPTNNWLAVGFRDGRTRILDAASLRDNGTVQLRPQREVFGVRWVLGDRSFAAAGANNGVAFYRIQPAKNDATGAAVLNVQGRLAQDDARDRVRTNSFCKVYDARLEGGRTYVIDLVSNELDPYLRVEDADGQQLAEDDDSGGNLNARLVFTPPVSATYRLIATTFAANTTGAFHLRVTER